MSHWPAWRAYVFLLLSCFPLLLLGPAAIAPVRSVSPTSLSVQTAVGSNVGPQASITCPAGAVNIVPDQSIQPLVNMYPGGTTFCLRAGVHRLTDETVKVTCPFGPHPDRHALLTYDAIKCSRHTGPDWWDAIDIMCNRLGFKGEADEEGTVHSKDADKELVRIEEELLARQETKT